jgi:hypothetical protein
MPPLIISGEGEKPLPSLKFWDEAASAWTPLPLVTDGLPGPVSGTTLQTHRDESGSWWLARGNLAGGVWRRATDVLHARVFRSAAVSTANYTPFGFDAIDHDPYQTYVFTAGLANTGRFVCPIPGFYRFYAQSCWTSTTGGQFCYLDVHRNAAHNGRGVNWSQGTAQIWSTHCEATGNCTVGETYAMAMIATAGLVVGVGVGQTFATFNYLGTHPA